MGAYTVNLQSTGEEELLLKDLKERRLQRQGLLSPLKETNIRKLDLSDGRGLESVSDETSQFDNKQVILC